LHSRKSRDGRFAIVLNDLNVRSEFSEQRAHDAFRLVEHRAEQMFGLNLLILISFGQLNAGLNRFLASECEFI
jgi:hypothetical protein